MMLGFSIFGSLLARHIHSGIPGISALPAGDAGNIETGNIPNSLSPELVILVKTAFSHAFQNIFAIGIGFSIIAFLIDVPWHP